MTDAPPYSSEQAGRHPGVGEQDEWREQSFGQMLIHALSGATVGSESPRPGKCRISRRELYWNDRALRMQSSHLSES